MLLVLAGAGVSCGGGEGGDGLVVIVNPNPSLDPEATRIIELFAEVAPDVEVWYGGASDLETLPEAVTAALARGPDVIVSLTTPGAVAVAAADASVPHVFSAVNDPVGVGLVATLAEPGGIRTGVGGNQHAAKALERLVTATGGTSFLVFVDPDDGGSTSGRDAVVAAADTLGVEVDEVQVDDLAELTDALGDLPDVDGIVVPPSSLIGPEMEEVIVAAKDAGIPVASAVAGEVPLGVLVAVAIDWRARAEQVVALVEAVLDGETPADIPVVTPVQRTVVDLTVAADLGIDLPDELVTLADEVRR